MKCSFIRKNGAQCKNIPWWEGGKCLLHSKDLSFLEWCEGFITAKWFSVFGLHIKVGVSLNWDWRVEIPEKSWKVLSCGENKVRVRGQNFRLSTLPKLWKDYRPSVVLCASTRKEPVWFGDYRVWNNIVSSVPPHEASIAADFLESRGRKENGSSRASSQHFSLQKLRDAEILGNLIEDAYQKEGLVRDLTPLQSK